MDLYKYVSKVGTTLSIGSYVIAPYDAFVSTSPVPELDAFDGVFLDKYLNGVPVPPVSEYNTIHLTVEDKIQSSVIFRGTGNEGWHDLLSPTTINPSSSIEFAPFIDNIQEYRFNIGNDSFHQYHIPHDYLPGSDIYIHVHWSHNSASSLVGQSVTWQIEATYAKGYSQDQFNTPIVRTIVAPFSTQYTHVISEVPITGPGLLDVSRIETDGIMKVRLSLLSNTTVPAAEVKPFMFFCDLHYKSTGLPTPNRNVPFLNA